MRRTRLAVTLVLLGLSLVASAAASPQPRPICAACGPAFGGEVADRDRNGSLHWSTATIRIDEAGAAHWTVRNRLANHSTVEQFRENPALLDRVAKDTLDHGNGLPVERTGSVGNVSATLNASGTAVIRFTDPDAGATYPGGIVRVDYLYQGGIGAGWLLDVDRLTVVGPPGTTITNDPGFHSAVDLHSYEVAADDRQFTVTVPDGSDPEYGPVLYEEGFLVFGPDSWATGPLTAVAVAAALAPLVTATFVAVHLLGLVVLSGLLLGVHWSKHERTDSRRALGAWMLAAWLFYLIPALWVAPPVRPYTFAPLFTAAFAVYAGVLGIVAGFRYPA
ncbi:hypothetical protein SAMN05216388_100542 [Halorientalis persicus]|uniref:Uncharacterized protein n=1 Tax=Halorientalis persicus TaxID=1367881 RepID=A0A1H8JDW2_9EURY|nr:hypothetical protein [Halorientalis persicus]SEN78516.1 hypothetical protein SAMN05216388_100542 [Halorientalis persicus]